MTTAYYSINIVCPRPVQGYGLKKIHKTGSKILTVCPRNLVNFNKVKFIKKNASKVLSEGKTKDLVFHTFFIYIIKGKDLLFWL